MQVPVLMTILALLLAACGTGGGTDGGGSGLPGRGVVAYEKVAPAPEMDVDFLVPEGAEPAAYITARGVEMLVALDDGVYHTSAPDGLNFTELGLVRSGMSAPAVTEVEGTYAVAWQEGGEVHLAIAGQPGDAATYEAVLYAVPGAASPSVVWADGAVLLYVLMDAALHLYRVALDGAADYEGVVLESDEECIDELGDRCWDHGGIGSAEVQRATTPLGRRVYRLMYTGVGVGAARGIGFAASFDGRDFSRYPFNPTFSVSARELAPSNVRLGDRYLLYFQDRVGTAEGVGVAYTDPENPSDAW